MSKEKEIVWRKLKRPVLSDYAIHKMYYDYRATLPIELRATSEWFREREHRKKTMQDLIDLGLIE